MRLPFFLHFFLCLILFTGKLQAQNGCKDTAFTMDGKQFICALKLIGEWKQDSTGLSIDSLAPSKEDRKWIFGIKKYLKVEKRVGAKVNSITGQYVFTKGYMKFTDIAISEGGRITSPFSYRVLYLSQNRMVFDLWNPYSKEGHTYYVLNRIVK